MIQNVGLMDLKKVYNRVNRQSKFQVLRMYDVGGELLTDSKGIYVNLLLA